MKDGVREVETTTADNACCSGSDIASCRVCDIIFRCRSRHERLGAPCGARGATRALCVGRSSWSRPSCFGEKMREAMLIAPCSPLNYCALITNVKGRRPVPTGRAQMDVMRFSCHRALYVRQSHRLWRAVPDRDGPLHQN